MPLKRFADLHSMFLRPPARRLPQGSGIAASAEAARQGPASRRSQRSGSDALSSSTNAITSGWNRLGSYEVIDALGAGGMSACGPRAERVGELRRAHLGARPGPQRA